MKKFIGIIMAMFCMMFALTGCSSTGGFDVSISDETTIFEETKFGTGSTFDDEEELDEEEVEGDEAEEAEDQDGNGADDNDGGEATEEYIKA